MERPSARVAETASIARADAADARVEARAADERRRREAAEARAAEAGASAARLRGEAETTRAELTFERQRAATSAAKGAFYLMHTGPHTTALAW